MAGIPENIIDQVRERTDIVEVISRYIPLKRSGRNFKAPCPFHHEKTPSFMVSPVKQIYHCFGCGAGGNVFSFLMKHERMEFPEAVRELAKKAGVTVPEFTKQDKARDSLTEKLYSINNTALSFYSSQLLSEKHSAAARQYIADRRLSARTAEDFKLGYAPRSWTGLLDYLKKSGFSEPALERCGLILKGKEGRFYDRFRDRIIFPISDMKGKVRGFGSRVLDNKNQPKYMNSPETPVYNKGSHLYGLNLTWQHIRDENTAIVVEGYLDLITPYQYGVRNIVASLGTALTLDQVRLLKRYAERIILLFDADAAGQGAALRSLDMLVEEEMKVSVAQLEKGSDPDSFVNKYGAEAFKGEIDKAQDIFDFKINALLAMHEHKSLDGKAKIADEMLPLISRVKNGIIQAGYLKRLAEILSIEEVTLKRKPKRPIPPRRYWPG
jgi:DNA primase